MYKNTACQDNDLFLQVYKTYTNIFTDTRAIKKGKKHRRVVLAGLFVPLGESEEKFLFGGKAGVMLVLRRTNTCCRRP